MTTLNGPILAEYQDLYSSSSTNGGPGGTGALNLGQKAYSGDGREFRFVLAGGTALVPGKLQQAQAETTGWENLGIAAAAVGANTITTTSTVTVTANAWAGGFVMVTITPGVGYMYRIKSNPAATSAVVTITLDDTIQVALTTSSKIDVIASPYNAVIVNPATATGTPVGVAIYPVTASQYGWIQVTGATNLLADGAITVGTSLVASNAVAGAVEPATGVQALVGTAITAISDTEYGSVMLKLA
ncbi:MAG: hypothetical protein KGL39_30205 [Patescibacteria group bacterium]|nr:hypothetical protein [Patescibacteria group bacterium]